VQAVRAVRAGQCAAHSAGRVGNNHTCGTGILRKPAAASLPTPQSLASAPPHITLPAARSPLLPSLNSSSSGASPNCTRQHRRACLE
jgi:hypothetical protein